MKTPRWLLTKTPGPTPRTAPKRGARGSEGFLKGRVSSGFCLPFPRLQQRHIWTLVSKNALLLLNNLSIKTKPEQQPRAGRLFCSVLDIPWPASTTVLPQNAVLPPKKCCAPAPVSPGTGPHTPEKQHKAPCEH